MLMVILNFLIDRVYNQPNPKATRSNPKDIKKKIIDCAIFKRNGIEKRRGRMAK